MLAVYVTVDSRRLVSSALLSPNNAVCPKTSTVFTERSKEWHTSSLGIRTNVSQQPVHSSASPSEEEVTLPV
ncbi:hypothetical protein OUZ56_004360 [Daphnia magna]|uniref:Uncharacterized protein n=1 Tax=Daphnia magna TaxID=35525 RepID=A0ABQ9YPJ2_9CRUS|nr:hypothetical protein OUZ56_004360 [Daphnia magna]